MTGAHSRTEQRVAATCLIVFASLLMAMVVVEMIMVTSPERFTLQADFLQKANLHFVMPYFLAYLVIGGLGLVGVTGLVMVYGQSQHYRMTARVAQACALAYFAINYWLWSAMWIVQHKITLLTRHPTHPEDWVAQIFDAADAFWSLAGWGGMGPAILLFATLGLLMLRGVHLLTRAAAWTFIALAVLQFVSLVYVGLRGFGISNEGEFSLILDLLLVAGRILAFLLAGTALYVEKGVFSRSGRSH